MVKNIKKILVVDDNPNNLSLVTSLIKPYYEVLLANNGEKALQIATEKIPDLILLDIMMPDISGFEVCEKLKQKEETNPIPIIFLTAKSSGDDFEKAYEAGGVDYVTKPINAKELLARISTHLTLCEQQGSLKKLNKEINALNGSLEIKVNERTIELENAIIELEKKNNEIEQASYVISHNLRGPVANILGLRNIFNRTNLADPLNGEILDRFSVAIDNLNDIINDLSAIITLRSESLPLENTNLKEVITEVKNNLEAEITTSKASIEIDVGSTPELNSVKSYLKSVFFNLLSNSIKYRSSKPLLIKIFSEKKDGAVNVYINDNGIGIEPNYLNKVFEPYKNLSTEPGKGLGLYLAKIQMEALKGKVSVISKPGKGATFVLSFKQLE